MRALLGCGLIVLGLCQTAEAQNSKVTVAIFAPNAPFESAETRYAFISRLADAIQANSSLVVEPKAFARAADFEAAVSRGQVDFAILDGIYLAGRGVPFAVLAIAASSGEIQPHWALYAADATNVIELRGKRLAYAASSSRDLLFIDNVLLDSELPHHFGDRQVTPDIASSVAAVALKKADCVFAPEGHGRGLRKIFEAPRVANPALVQVKAALSGDIVAKVRQAALGQAGTAVYDGWRAGSADVYRNLAARFAPRPRRPLMADPEIVRLGDEDLLLPWMIAPAMPDLKEQFWVPIGSP